MDTQSKQSLRPLESGGNKDRYFKAQLRRVLEALKEKPMTMKEVDVCTGIMRENICRYVSDLMESGMIAVRKRRRCSITGFPLVNEYTGNPDLFPKSNQLKLF
tara:strand:+ start:1086 stop:1394 length:309 start_codon:yes stop_codon:yes gene_type:complete